MTITWAIQFTPDFKRDFESLPHNIIESFKRNLDFLRSNPYQKNTNAIPLKNQNSCFRLRLGDYRLIYRIIGSFKQIILLHLRHRKEVYESNNVRAGMGNIEELLERPKNIKTTKTTQKTVRDIPVIEPETSKVKPNIIIEKTEDISIEEVFLDANELFLIKIPDKYHDEILKCKNLDDLKRPSIPDSIRDLIIDYITNPSHTHIGKLYTLEPHQDIESISKQSLNSFLLTLDAQQKAVVDKPLDQGPIIVRGGPGTGKTLISLYRLKRIIQQRLTEDLFQSGHKPNYVFLSYTNSLVEASREMFNAISSDYPQKFDVSFLTFDKLVVRVLDRYFCNKNIPKPNRLNEKELEDKLLDIINKMSHCGTNEKVNYANMIQGKYGIEFLAEEIQSVIEGNNIKSLDEYLNFQRIGRKVALQETIRRAIWHVFIELQEVYKKEKCITWSGYRKTFLNLLRTDKNILKQKADVLIVDEIQDLSPVSLQIMMEIVENKRFLMFSSDTGQSIYCKSPTWKNVHPDLRFHRGNSFILRKTYRMTKQIAKALSPLRVDTDTDGDIIGETEAVFNGEKPVWIEVKREMQINVIKDIVKNRILNKGINPGQVGIILRVLQDKNKTVELLQESLSELGVKVERQEANKKISINGSAIHVLTSHSSKGLEFPCIIVPFISDSTYPLWTKIKKAKDTQAETELAEEERRLLYVATSRASRFLWIISDKDRPSRFLRLLNKNDWIRQEVN
jgi:superfamily I DNA/RNA helicase/mRNA-degrading endonuclease RelE of RelBE toxin-antitoxin system